MLGNQGEVGVGWIVEHRGGEEAAGGGDEGGGRSLSPLRRDDFALEDAFEWGDFDIGVGVDVNVVVFESDIGEEALPERGEMELGVGEEEEGDFGAAEAGGEMGFGGGEAGGRAAGEIGGIHGYGLVEE